jgi:SRSO17 transposase
MPVVPSSLDALLSLFADAFSAPVFETFRMLVVGFLCRVGERSVVGMLQAARLQRTWHHSRAHAFFAERHWSADELGLLLLAFVVARFVPGDAPIKLAVDDSLFTRWGRRVYGAAWQYDGSKPAGGGRAAQVGYGNNWVIVTVIVTLPFMTRTVSLPILSRLWRPDPEAKAQRKQGRRPKPNPAYPSKCQLARQLLELVAAAYPQREIEMVGDCAYATKALGSELGERVMISSRLKANARLYAPKPERTGKRGRPAKKGKRLPRLAQIADDPTTVWEQTEVTREGKRRTVHAHRFEALFYDVWGERPVQVVLVRERERTTGYDVALISMNIKASVAQIIEFYDERWSIEVCIEGAKQITGVGQARNRVKRAVERTVPFGLLCQSLVICWYALHGQAERDVKRRRWLSPWYPHKRSPSLQDMLSSLRREVIAAQYPPLTPRTANQPQIPSSPQTLDVTAA